MRKIQLAALILVLFALGACNDDDTTTNPETIAADLSGSWTGDRVVQVITPVDHVMAVQLWANILSTDPPLTCSGEFTRTGDDLTIRLTDSQTGYFTEYEGSISTADIELSSTIISYPPMVTRIPCGDGIDRHYGIVSSTISAIVNGDIFAGTLEVTANVFISETGLADGQIVLHHTIDLDRAD